MIKFLLKGLVRDRHRSLFPVIIVSAGVMITILINCWVRGVVGDITTTNAKLDTGHVKIMTRAYADIADQAPNDLAIFGVSELLADLQREYPRVDWAPRIKFGGLLDIPDEQGETRAQGPVAGLALDLFSPDSQETQRLNLDEAVVRGHLPQAPGEIVVSDQFAKDLGVTPGETATLISATANGSMAVYNFTIAGTIRFGVGAMDKSAMIADISDIQYALDMADGAGVILGFLPKMMYDKAVANRIAESFHATYEGNPDEFAPMMLTLREQNGLGEYLDMVNTWILAYVVGFIIVMSIVLWNTGLMSGIRRYGEIGVRLAIGENKGHVYRTLIYEAILIGVIGSVLGTLMGLGISYYLQERGIDISGMMQGGTILMSTVLRARITPAAFYIGFIPGLVATTLGAMMSGIGIFKRQTSQLFKELET
ncbi:FtsX-like permease family protein [candidate division KSB3 bacterium]|uniref:FtsX-like permease family protein n=1 Tax=candidate division KSB3 bacterium TaxID=2044937 RepID=A0A9D5Q4A4_9BACT|nr:FtsX-like permease family protein [candidate division KSB3 bacterium]MBD3323038.1 FtsX-like permease family protein [candidate division KSB3 bacterium]